jgi:hypothetical protein
MNTSFKKPNCPIPSASTADMIDNSCSAVLSLEARDYECPICLSLLIDPVVGHCGHDFCKSCLEEWRSNSFNGTSVSCPACRQVAIAGVQTLGVCIRLQALIEQAYPQEVARRRKEILDRAVEREFERSSEIALQVNTVQALMRARMSLHSSSLQLNSVKPSLTHGGPSVSRNREFSHHNHDLLSTTQSSASTLTSTSEDMELPSLRGDWRSDMSDLTDRELMAERLVTLFHTRRPCMEEGFKARLPRLVSKIEEELYRSASSMVEYLNEETLESRIHLLVRRLLGARMSAGGVLRM